MKETFDGFKEGLMITSVSPWLMQRASASPIFSGKNHCVVMNGLDTNVFHSRKSYLREELGETGQKVIFHATPNFNLDSRHIKGGYYVNELAKRMPDVKFLVAGSYLEGIVVSNNVILLGKVANQQKLAELYSMADLTLLTSKRETFSMVTAESLCCGTAVIGFQAGGPEQIAIPEYSCFVDHGDMSALKNETEKMLNNCWDSGKISKEAQKNIVRKLCVKTMLKYMRDYIIWNYEKTDYVFGKNVEAMSRQVIMGK